jgi:S-adenosylmethionine decarboxylase
MHPPTVSNVFVKISGIKTGDAGDLAALRALLREIATALHLKVLKEAFHAFDPGGITGVLLLAESHVAIHSWPENNYAVVELLTCKPFGAAEQAALVAELHRALGEVTLAISVNH